MTDLPAPLNDCVCDLRDFRWMKLDLMALFNSRFNCMLDDTAWRAGVTLWGRAWHQVPAGSLPDDDAELCNLAGFGRDLKTWKKVRAKALHGFILCSDGRLYHTYLCRIAKEAYEEKTVFERKRAADRARKQGSVSPHHQVESVAHSDGIPAEIHAASNGIPVEIAVEGEGDKRREESKLLVQTPNPRARALLGLELVKPCEKTGRPLCGGWYLDYVQERVFEAANIDEVRWTGNIRPLLEWLAAGIEPDTIIETVQRCADREGYAVPRSLGYFKAAVMEAFDRVPNQQRRQSIALAKRFYGEDVPIPVVLN